MFEDLCSGVGVDTIAVIGVFLIPVLLFFFIYKIIDSSNRRKVAVIQAEKGVQPQDGCECRKSPCSSLIVWATSLIGLGAGVALASLFANDYAETAIVLVMLGAGMLGGYFLSRSVDKK